MSTQRKHTTVRIQARTKRLLQNLAAAERRPMQAILHSALEKYRRERFLDEVNAAYAALREREGEWLDWQGEQSEWESTLGDGLAADRGASEEVYGAAGRKPGKTGRRSK